MQRRARRLVGQRRDPVPLHDELVPHGTHPLDGAEPDDDSDEDVLGGHRRRHVTPLLPQDRYARLRAREDGHPQQTGDDDTHALDHDRGPNRVEPQRVAVDPFPDGRREEKGGAVGEDPSDTAVGVSTCGRRDRRVTYRMEVGSSVSGYAAAKRRISSAVSEAGWAWR